jgi:hypothetical protein
MTCPGSALLALREKIISISLQGPRRNESGWRRWTGRRTSWWWRWRRWRRLWPPPWTRTVTQPERRPAQKVTLISLNEPRTRQQGSIPLPVPQLDLSVPVPVNPHALLSYFFTDLFPIPVNLKLLEVILFITLSTGALFCAIFLWAMSCGVAVYWLYKYIWSTLN